MFGRGEESCVFSVGHLAGGQLECIHPDAVHGPFVVAPGRAAHLKPALGDAHHHRLDKIAAPLQSKVLRIGLVSGHDRNYLSVPSIDLAG